MKQFKINRHGINWFFKNSEEEKCPDCGQTFYRRSNQSNVDYINFKKYDYDKKNKMHTITLTCYCCHCEFQISKSERKYNYKGSE